MSVCVSRARDIQVRSLWVFRFNPWFFFRFNPSVFFSGSIPVVPQSYFYLYFFPRLIIFREVAVLFFAQGRYVRCLLPYNLTYNLS